MFSVISQCYVKSWALYKQPKRVTPSHSHLVYLSIIYMSLIFCDEFLPKSQISFFLSLAGARGEREINDRWEVFHCGS